MNGISAETRAQWAADPIVKHGPFTRSEALAFIRKHARGRTLFVYAGAFLPTGDEHGFETSCNVRVSVKLAVKYVGDLLPDSLERRGARMRVSMCSGCMFIG